MQAVTWVAPGELRLQEKAIPKPGHGEVLVKVMAASICGSDLKISKTGNPRVERGRTMGHEGAGIVVLTGDGVQSLAVGDRIAIGADIPCGACGYCTSGTSTSCPEGLAIGHQYEGTFAEFVLLNRHTVNFGPIAKLSSGTDFDSAALAEPLACAINGFERATNGEKLRKGAGLAIIGAGPVGVMLAKLARIFGFTSVAIFDVNQTRLEKVGSLGISAELIELDPNGALASKGQWGSGFDLVFSANSSTESQSLAIEIARPRGVVNLFGGLPHGTLAARVPTNLIHYRELKVVGSHGSTPQQHMNAISLIESGEVDLSGLVTSRFSLEAYLEAFKVAGAGSDMKVMFKARGGEQDL